MEWRIYFTIIEVLRILGDSKLAPVYVLKQLIFVSIQQGFYSGGISEGTWVNIQHFRRFRLLWDAIHNEID